MEEIFERCRTLKRESGTDCGPDRKIGRKRTKDQPESDGIKTYVYKAGGGVSGNGGETSIQDDGRSRRTSERDIRKLELVRNNYETVTRCLTEKQNKEKELEGQQKTVSASVVQSQEEVQKKIRSYKQIIKEQGFEDEESYHSQCMTERELEEAEQWIGAYQKELQELEANRTLLEQQLEEKKEKIRNRLRGR